MSRSTNVFFTRQLVSCTLEVVRGRVEGVAYALALVCALVAPSAVRAQCSAAWVPGIGQPGTSASNQALAVLPNGDVIVAGNFDNAGGVPAAKIARYTPSTGVWSPLGTGFTGFPVALAVLPNGDLVVGGNFSTAGGVPANRVARFNPTTGVWSAFGTGINGVVNALAVLPNGNVIVGGNFTLAGGISAVRIAELNPSTNGWSALGTGLSLPGSPAVLALAGLPGGDVIAGGTFNQAGSVPASRIARYSPSLPLASRWSALGAGVAGEVYALALLPTGDLIVGGIFTSAGGVPASNIARYNTTTNAWSALGAGVSAPFSSQVNAISVLPSGDLIVAGSFASAGGVAVNNIARYNLSTNTWSSFGTGVGTYLAGNSARALAVLPGGGVIVAGSFPTAGGVTANNIARYTFGNLSDIAGPGQSIGSDDALTADDIIVFLNWFFAGNTGADVAGPGQSTTPDGQFTADDIIVFLNRFFAGC